MLVHDLRAVLRLARGRATEPSTAVLWTAERSTQSLERRQGRLWRAPAHGSCETAWTAGTLGYLLALYVPPTHADDRSAEATLVETVHDATDQNVALTEWSQNVV